MANVRKVEIYLRPSVGLCIVSDGIYDDGSEAFVSPLNIITGGMGEWSIEQNVVNLALSAARIKLVHKSGQVMGEFGYDDILTFAIDGADQLGTATNLGLVVEACAPYLFSNGGSGYTYSSIVELTPTMLTTMFSGAGIELLPAFGAGKYPDWEMDLVNTADGTEIYAGGNVFEIKSDTQILARVDNTLLTGVAPTQMVAIGVRPSQLQGANARFQPTAPNMPLMLKTISNTDFTLADVADGSTCYAIIRYNIKSVPA